MKAGATFIVHGLVELKPDLVNLHGVAVLVKSGVAVLADLMVVPVAPRVVRVIDVDPRIDFDGFEETRKTTSRCRVFRSRCGVCFGNDSGFFGGLESECLPF